jgi:hypothetical protein
VAHRSNPRLQAKLLRTTELQFMAAMASSSRTAASRPLTPLSLRPAAPSGSGGRARGRLLTSPQFTTASGRRAQDLRPDSRRRARVTARWCGLQMSTTRELCNQCHRLRSFLPKINAKSAISWCLVPTPCSLVSHQPAVLFSQNKSATNNQPAVLFSQNKSAPAISHQPNEQAASVEVVSW